MIYIEVKLNTINTLFSNTIVSCLISIYCWIPCTKYPFTSLPISIVPLARNNTWTQTDIQCGREKLSGIKINILRPTVSKITFVNWIISGIYNSCRKAHSARVKHSWLRPNKTESGTIDARYYIIFSILYWARSCILQSHQDGLMQSWKWQNQLERENAFTGLAGWENLFVINFIATRPVTPIPMCCLRFFVVKKIYHPNSDSKYVLGKVDLYFFWWGGGGWRPWWEH